MKSLQDVKQHKKVSIIIVVAATAVVTGALAYNTIKNCEKKAGFHLLWNTIDCDQIIGCDESWMGLEQRERRLNKRAEKRTKDSVWL